METPSKFTFKSDFIGRIRNISLSPSPGNCLAPLYEAITNSIQAIEDRFGKDNLTQGIIKVEVLRAGRDDDRPTGFLIKDNGIGFTPENLKSFLTSDSQYKLGRGGKGVGRFLWLKVFSRVQVQSTYDSEDGRRSIAFNFEIRDENQVDQLTISDSTEAQLGTAILLEAFNAEYSAHCPKKLSTLTNKIISHFLSYFINMHAPRIILQDSAEVIDLFDRFTGVVTRDQTYEFRVPTDAQNEEFKLHAFLLPKEFSDDEKGHNALFYGANGRTVERHELDQALGLKRIEDEFVYFGYVESPFLDLIANQERTHLSWPGDLFEGVHRVAIDLSKTFLREPIRRIRELQAETITAIRNEHLRFLNIAEKPEEFAEQLALSVQRPEDIYLELSRASLRQYNRKKRSFNDAKKKKLPDFDEKAKEYARELKSDSISSLAEYMLKRKLIIDVFEDRLKFKDIDSERYFFEEAVHEIICPLRETTDSLSYDDHNLWMIDDSLAFYTYFASDKTIRSTTGGADESLLEPDIAIFDLGLGFNQAGSLEPITIV